MIYYTVADADATTRAVEAGGGTVRVAPTDIEQWGRMAQYSDPLGGQFAVWQPGESKGVDLVDAPGSLCWTELYTSDAGGARRFYGDVFGWRFTDMPMPGGEGTYTLITPAYQPEDRMHGGLLEVGEDALSLAAWAALLAPRLRGRRLRRGRRPGERERRHRADGPRGRRGRRPDGPVSRPVQGRLRAAHPDAGLTGRGRVEAGAGQTAGVHLDLDPHPGIGETTRPSSSR